MQNPIVKTVCICIAGSVAGYGIDDVCLDILSKAIV
jgi:hypothetical protein